MRRRRIVLACLAATIFGGGRARAAEQVPPKQSPQPASVEQADAEPAAVEQADATASPEVARLVAQLGASTFAQRESATRQLAAIGLPARDALLAALRGPDAEVRDRARRVLQVVLERDFQARLRDFAVDHDPHAGHGLGCWDRYARLVGQEAAARRLFVEMQRAESGLLEASETDSLAAGELLEARTRQLQEGEWVDDELTWQGASVGRIAALLFVAAQHDTPLSDVAASYVANFVYQNSFLDGVSGGPAAAPLRKILGAWVMRPVTASSNLRVQNLMMSIQHELPETLPLALAMLKDPPGEPYPRAYTILAVARFGDRAHLEPLAPLLDDAASCGEYEIDGRTLDCQVRDVALAALLHLSGQNLADYGFDRVEVDSPLLDISRMGFANDTDRQAALARWRAWQAEQP
jgi:hypothetical protein